MGPDKKQACLWRFQGLFGDDHNKNGFKMFDSSDYHGQDLLFKDATIRAEPVGEKTTYLDWLGPDYVAALEGMLSQQCSRAGRAGAARRLGKPWTGRCTAHKGRAGVLPCCPASPEPVTRTLSELRGALGRCR